MNIAYTLNFFHYVNVFFRDDKKNRDDLIRGSENDVDLVSKM